MLQWRGQDRGGDVVNRGTPPNTNHPPPTSGLCSHWDSAKDNFFFYCLLGTQDSSYSFEYVHLHDRLKKFFCVLSWGNNKLVSIWKNGFQHLLTNIVLNWRLKVHFYVRYPFQKTKFEWSKTYYTFFS